MLRAACGRGGTSTKIRSDCGTQVLGGKKGGGAGGEEHLIPTLLITFCNHPIIPCLVSKSKMATPQKQTLTVTGRSPGEKYTRSARYIKTKHSDKKQTTRRNKPTNIGRECKSIREKKKHQSLKYCTCWEISRCGRGVITAKNASKSVMHVQIDEELLFCLASLLLSLLSYVFARSLMISFFSKSRIRSMKEIFFVSVN